MSGFTAAQATKVDEAQAILQELNFDAERSNQRSALVLLALAGVTPATAWVDASGPMRGTTEIMNWIEEHYGVSYAPNTRETVRRFTLHQFVAAGLVVENPDDPKRPINSPKWVYQLTPEALAVLRAIGTPRAGAAVADYTAKLPGLVAKYKAAREMKRIPVTLPDGSAVKLSPGGQNELLKAIIDEFCPRFTPKGEVLYIGDAAKKSDEVYEVKRLADLGIVLPERGKKPDLIIYMPDRNWLVIIEAASTHGPVDAKRHGELKTLFAGSTAGLVFVSAFPTRADMRKYVDVIAWETDAWYADHPDHLVHFNGERFLGPYEQPSTNPLELDAEEAGDA